MPQSIISNNISRLQDLFKELVETNGDSEQVGRYLYNPSICLAKPTILKDLLSCIIHWSNEKLKLQDKESQSLATEMRFKWKFGEYKTLVR